ncbi:MAG: helix-turn-helix transcriptional regulator, partial [Sneathiella sp.]
YDRLTSIADMLDEQKDIQEVNEILEALENGEIETYPGEMVKRLLNGANPIREFRKFRKMTGCDLASAIGVTQGYISDLETGKKSGTVETIRKIAECLNVTIEELIE